RFSPEDKSRCIFIDESGFNNHLRKTQARSRRGQRATTVVPTIRGTMKTLIVAASRAGIIHHKLILDGTCNDEKFKLFIEDLIRILDSSSTTTNCWIIMDNAKIHKVESVRTLIEAAGHRLEFLSPHSYMLNPVENIFSKIKCLIRSQLAIRFSSKNDIELAGLIDDAVRAISEEDCINYIMHMLHNIALAIEKHIFE
ncbi:hypothetical protein ENBRE01_3304, partial [Enteropsectra breve]